MQDQATGAEERAVMWERRARAFAAAFDEVANGDLFDDIQNDAICAPFEGTDERIWCIGCGGLGWPQEGFILVEGDGQCQPCIAELAEEQAS